MSSNSKTNCDLCGIVKPTDFKEYGGWALVLISGDPNGKDFCKSCWAPVQKIMTRAFVDELLKPVMEKT